MHLFPLKLGRLLACRPHPNILWAFVAKEQKEFASDFCFQRQVWCVMGLVCDGIHTELQDKSNLPRGESGAVHDNDDDGMVIQIDHSTCFTSGCDLNKSGGHQNRPDDVTHFWLLLHEWEGDCRFMFNSSLWLIRTSACLSHASAPTRNQGTGQLPCGLMRCNLLVQDTGN